MKWERHHFFVLFSFALKGILKIRQLKSTAQTGRGMSSPQHGVCDLKQQSQPERAEACLGPAAGITLPFLGNCPDRSRGTRDLGHSHLTRNKMRLQPWNVWSGLQAWCKYSPPHILFQLPEPRKDETSKEIETWSYVGHQTNKKLEAETCPYTTFPLK